MKAELRALLAANPAVLALLPGRVASINWGLHPAGVSGAYLVLTQVSGERGHGTNTPLGPRSYRVQIDCYALTAQAADALSEAVLAAIDGHQAEPFLGIFFLNASDDRDGEENQPIHRVRMDFTVVSRGLEATQ